MRIPCLSVDYPQEEKERRKKEELCVPCNSAPHLFPLLGCGYYMRLVAFGVLYKTFLRI